MKIAIVGRKADTMNYERFVTQMPVHFDASAQQNTPLPVTTLSLGELAFCDALLLPGGGDITPAFFGENNFGSKNIDTELDIIQFQALDYAIRQKLPVLGICKGMQVINVAFGGTIIQDLPTASYHQYIGRDRYHSTTILANTCLHRLYGEKAIVNSAHHQGVGILGSGLQAIQWCDTDNCVEAIVHDTLPILGLQWHPERLDAGQTTVSGAPLLSLFSSLIQNASNASVRENGGE